MATPSHVDLSVLWVPIMPETSGMDSAMEKAGKDAKDSFAKSTKDIGKPIEEAIDAAGKQASKSMEEAGKQASTGFRGAVTGLAKDVGSSIKTELGGAFKDIGAAVRGGDVAGAFDGVRGKISDIGEITKKVGIDIGDWKAPVDKADDAFKSMTDEANDTLKSVTDISSQFESMPGKIGKIASGLGKVGVIAGTVVETLNAIKDADHYLENRIPFYKQMDEDFKNRGMNRFFKNLFGDKSPDDGPLPPGITRGPDGSLIATGGDDKSWYTNDWFFGGTHPTVPSLVPMTGAPNPWWTDRMRRDQWGFTHWEPAPEPHGSREPSPPREHHSSSGGRVSGRGLSSRILGGANSRSGLRAAGGQVANLYAFAQSLEGTPYSKALRNDCSGMVARLANVALGLPPEASFTTVNEGQWLFSHGFEPGLGGPNDLNIGWYDHGGGNLGHTAATLPGGVHAESGGSHGSFLLGPGAAGAEDPQFTQHAHLSMGRGAGSLGGKEMPLGTEHDPVYVSQASGSGSGGSPFEGQGQELGQGLINGVLQEFGLDGSVFGGKSPLDWGAVKLGGGLLNWGMKTAQSLSGTGMPVGSGGGMGGLGGLAGLIPSPGAMLSAAAKPAGGSFGIKDAAAGAPTSITHDNRITLTNPTFHPQSPVVRGLQEMQNSRTSGALSGLPVPSIGTP